MKTLRMPTLLAICLGLTGCGAGLDVLLTAVTVGGTYLIMDHETNRALGAIGDQQRSADSMARRAFIAQCMNENWTQKKEKERKGTWEEISKQCRQLAHETLDVDPSPP